MYNEKAPSLFIPKLAALLFVAIFLSGMAEIVLLATSAEKSHYSIVNETSKLIPQPSKVHAPNTQLLHPTSVN